MEEGEVAVVEGHLLSPGKEVKRGRLDVEDAIALIKGRSEEPSPSFVEAIRASGVMHDVIITIDEDEKWRLVDGVRRIKAASLAGQKSVPYKLLSRESIIADVPGQKRYGAELGEAALLLSLNAHRSTNHVVELRALERLAKVMPEAEIAKQLKIGLSTVRRRLQLLKLAPELRVAFERGNIATGVAEAIAKQSKEVQAAMVQRLDESEDDTLSAADLRSVREVGQSDAIASLPDALFGTDGTENDVKMRLGKVHQLLSEAVSLVIDSEDLEVVQAALQALREMVGERLAE